MVEIANQQAGNVQIGARQYDAFTSRVKTLRQVATTKDCEQ